MRTFDVSKGNGDQQDRLIEALGGLAPTGGESFNADTMEIGVNIHDPQEALARAREIMRAATEGTDLYVEPEPIGFSVPVG